MMLRVLQEQRADPPRAATTTPIFPSIWDICPFLKSVVRSVAICNFNYGLHFLKMLYFYSYNIFRVHFYFGIYNGKYSLPQMFSFQKSSSSSDHLQLFHKLSFASKGWKLE